MARASVAQFFAFFETDLSDTDLKNLTGACNKLDHFTAADLRPTFGGVPRDKLSEEVDSFYTELKRYLPADLRQQARSISELLTKAALQSLALSLASLSSSLAAGPLPSYKLHNGTLVEKELTTTAAAK